MLLLKDKKQLGKAERIVKNKRGTTEKGVITFSSQLIISRSKSK